MYISKTVMPTSRPTFEEWWKFIHRQDYNRAAVVTMTSNNNNSQSARR